MKGGARRPGAPAPFAFYRRLSATAKATYRQSDAASDAPIASLLPARRAAERLERALAAGERVETELAAHRLVRVLTTAFSVPNVRVRVRATRPRSATSELHGLYTRTPGQSPTIDVWMRTSQRGEVVQYRTFLRTLMHEVCHHLDYEWLHLSDSFHTKGFFRRESSLVRQLVGARERGATHVRVEREVPVVHAPPPNASDEHGRRRASPQTLALFESLLPPSLVRTGTARVPASEPSSPPARVPDRRGETRTPDASAPQLRLPID